jgi:hypothetical protein
MQHRSNKGRPLGGWEMNAAGRSSGCASSAKNTGEVVSLTEV